jgi:hypothetical protein
MRPWTRVPIGDDCSRAVEEGTAYEWFGGYVDGINGEYNEAEDTKDEWDKSSP